MELEEAEEEIKRPKEEGSEDQVEAGDIICNLAGRSILQPQEDAKEDSNGTEDGKTMQLERMLAEKDALIGTLNKDLESSKASKGEVEKLLGDCEKVVEQLKGEIQRQKGFERRLYDSFVTQTSQLEQAQIFINKWKHKIGSARAREGREITSYEENYWLRLQVERLENEVWIQRNGRSPWEEVKRLRKEVELAVEAEENSKRAMDDLALVIKEVAADANQAKQKLQMMKEEADNLRSESEMKEKTHRLALTQAKKENETLKATIDRLRIELNGEETEFVDSIKAAEMEKVNMQEENCRLLESLNEAKDESRKIRDILKQAKVEIAHLKNSLAEKDKAFVNLTALQMRPYSRKDLKAEEKEQKKNKKEHSLTKGFKKRGDMKGRRRSSEDLKTCGMGATFCSIPLHVPGLSSKIKQVEEVRETDDGLTGSIFDIVQPSSVEVHRTRSASATTLTDDEITVHSDEYENTDRASGDDIQIDNESHRKKRVLRKKFSELWRRKSYSHSHTTHINSHHSQPHNHNQDQRELGTE